MNRKVTEADFRLPEYRDAQVEDYEFRADGKLVRKDRWEQGIRTIATILHDNNLIDSDLSIRFEIDEIVNIIRNLANQDNQTLKETFRLITSDLEVFMFWLERMETAINAEITDKTTASHFVDIHTQLIDLIHNLKRRFLY